MPCSMVSDYQYIAFYSRRYLKEYSRNVVTNYYRNKENTFNDSAQPITIPSCMSEELVSTDNRTTNKY